MSLPVRAPRFGGRSAIVTGAAQGIGLAIARRLLDEGARVALFDRNRGGAGGRACIACRAG